MAVFEANALSNPFPTTEVNLPADYQAAQQVQQGNNALTMQGQQVADMQQEVALRPGLLAGDPNALSQLTTIDPAAAAAQRQAQIANATLPYQMAQNRIALLGQGARGVLASDDHSAAYTQWLSTLPPSIASTLPQTYPGDGATQQMAFASMNPDDFIKYQQTHIVGAAGGGGAPAAPAPPSYSGAVAGAESGGNPNATSATSSAAGQDQFINATWLQEMKTHRPDLTNGQTDAQILAMRGNPQLSTEITNDYAADNTPILQSHSIPITPASLAMAHRFGPQGAVDLYAAENNNPSTPIESVLSPDAIKANPSLRGQTVGQVMGTVRTQMAGVPATATPIITVAAAHGQPIPGYEQHSAAGLAASIAPSDPNDPGASQPAQPTYVPAVGPNAGTQQPLSSTVPAGVTPLYHGDGTPALATDQPGYQLGRNAAGAIVPFAMAGGSADPAVLAQQAQAKAAADAGYSISNGTWVPIPGGPADPAAKTRLAVAGNTSGPLPAGTAVAPQQQPGSGPFPLPPTDPYAGQANNGALATRMNDDRTAANTTVAADAPIIQKDQANIQFDQQYHQLNADNPTGPYQGGPIASTGRAISSAFGSGAAAPYQEMDKLSANLKTAALPSNLGRLDLPIIKAVAAQQPSTTNLRQANDNIENIQIAAAQRDIDYRRARAQYVQQFGHLNGFEQMWSDYNNAVPTLSWGQGGTVQLAQGQPGFQQWVGARAPGGRYNPALAATPDNELPGAQQPQQQATPPPTQQAAATSSRPAIPAAAVAYLHANPGTAAQFDEMFGAGSSSTILGR